MLAAPAAAALPADGYDVTLLSHPGATTTQVRGVDDRGRALVYWARYDTPFPRPIGSPPDASGYEVWQDGVASPIDLPGLTEPRMDRMDAAGHIWGRADEGAFFYDGSEVRLVEGDGADLTVVQGGDSAGRVYGFLADYPIGVDPDAPIVPIEVLSAFVWEAGSLSPLDLGFDGAFPGGVLQDGSIWGSAGDDAFIRDPLGATTVLGHPDESYTGIFGVTRMGEAFGLAATFDEESSSSLEYFWHPDTGFETWPEDATLPGTSLRPHGLGESGVFWGTAEANVAFFARPVPEPGTAVMLALGALAFAVARRRTGA